MRTATLLLALALGGCSLGDGDDGSDRPGAGSGPRSEERVQPRKGESGEARAIRRWSAALNNGRFDRAASFFAENALVEQTEELRLRDRDAAVAFNRSLPCKSKVTDLKAEAGATVAAFDLEPGPGGGQACAGDARVRFVIERGRIKEWRQLRGPQGPSGDVVRRGAGGPGARHG